MGTCYKKTILQTCGLEVPSTLFWWEANLSPISVICTTNLLYVIVSHAKVDLPRKEGGLGITEYGIQNRCLLGKWVWRFNAETRCLWKEVISCKNNMSVSNLIPSPPNPRTSSWMWRDFLNSYYALDDQGSIFRSNLLLQVGDGKSVSFWNDTWACDQPLQSKFPRIFALAVKKSGMIVDFGFRCNNSWSWNIQLRRRLFDWEIPIWNSFQSLLNNFQSSGLDKDWIKWLGSSDGLYSPKSLRSLLAPAANSNVNWDKFVWIGLAPPMVEAFVWRLLHGRVPVKSELAKRGFFPSVDICCPFCSVETESIDHLFFSCNFSWRIWSSIANYWEISLVLQQNPMEVFLAWPHLCSKVDSTHMWRLLPFAIVWSIWLHRNEIVFQGKVVDVGQLLYNVKLRAAWWFKAKEPDSIMFLDLIISDPSLASWKAESISKSNASLAWSPPPLGFLKLNVDGACDRTSNCGVGGVLRNHQGVILLEFSRNIGTGSSLLAEILAIKFAVDYFINSEWSSKSRLIIESDSKVAVDWIACPISSHPTFLRLIKGINYFFATGRWLLRHINRGQNIFADNLAKKGIG
ncbi:hypothetical protein GQ457_15G008200 [Hibiscus cannabinus]